MSRALEGLRVVELAARPIALAGRILADLGADVVLVEPPGGADIRREAPLHESGESFAHLYFNANKRSVEIDFSSDAGQKQLTALLGSADVLLDTCLQTFWQGLGLDHEVLRRLNPKLVQCSVTPFGIKPAQHFVI